MPSAHVIVTVRTSGERRAVGMMEKEPWTRRLRLDRTLFGLTDRQRENRMNVATQAYRNTALQRAGSTHLKGR